MASLPLLLAEGSFAILGSKSTADKLIEPIVPGPASLFGPRGVCLVSDDGPLWVADTGHHRLLRWQSCPQADGAAADLLLGQPDFDREGRNAKGDVTATSLNVPVGVSICGQALAVADAWNHRVLIWYEQPTRCNQPADMVLGQTDFSSGTANRGQDMPDAASLFWPYGVAWDGQRLWVADTGNRRVLCWEGLPTRPNQAADRVLGQPDFERRDENSGADPTASSMRWPHAIAFLGGRLCVADAGNNRVMIWQDLPTRNGQACDCVIGQQDVHQVEHNQGEYLPTAASLNMPYSLGVHTKTARLLVADTANSRLLAWDEAGLTSGASASRLAGQSAFNAKGDNRWTMPERDSLCWPYGLAVSDDIVAIADAGNNRVLLWRFAAEWPE